ncbi:kinase-like protein [Clavulina sp. PMI_390]|nr:kinase-like protein [Clavulina sp. PMI_390]
MREARHPESQDWTSPEGKHIVLAIQREIISQIQIKHPNVLPILGISSHEDHPLAIVTPFAANGNAFSYLTDLTSAERPAVMLKIIHNITSALEYLHGMLPPIIHGDIHARNVLIDGEGQGLLCDFGLSRIKHEQTRTTTGVIEGGKLRYLAPELLLLQPNQLFCSTPASDCYAFAMTILELATLQKPFVEYQNEQAASNAAGRGLWPHQLPIEAFGTLGDSKVAILWKLLEEMWAHEPAERPTMQQVLPRVTELYMSHSQTPSQEHSTPIVPISPHAISGASSMGSLSWMQPSNPPLAFKGSPILPNPEIQQNNGLDSFLILDNEDHKIGTSLLHALDILAQISASPNQTKDKLAEAQYYARKVYTPITSVEDPKTPSSAKTHDLKRLLSALLCIHWGALVRSAKLDDILACVEYALHILPRLYEGDELDSKVARFLHSKGFALYLAWAYFRSIEPLQQSILLWTRLDTATDPDMLQDFIGSCIELSWVYLKVDEHAAALEQALKAVQLAKGGARMSNSHANIDKVWGKRLLAKSLSAVSKVYCAMQQFDNALIYGKQAAEFARDAFHSSSSFNTATTFALALEYYERPLAELGLWKDDSLDELCSPKDWRDMLHLLKGTGWALYVYVHEKVQSLDASQ